MLCIFSTVNYLNDHDFDVRRRFHFQNHSIETKTYELSVAAAVAAVATTLRYNYYVLLSYMCS